MAIPEHLDILKQGVGLWNRWKRNHFDVQPDLSRADLGGAKLMGADLRGASLFRARLGGADLSGAELSGADLTMANLSGADLTEAALNIVTLYGADLTGAHLTRAHLRAVRFSAADLRATDFTEADMRFIEFMDNDLSESKGLETVKHIAGSHLSIDTIYRSRGNIPEVFLRGCGVPEDFITYMRSLVVQPIQFYSCFISYSHKDEDFARRLFSAMRDANLRVWYAPEEMQGGRKLDEQIFSAIRLHDKLLLVLSENSLQSEWVTTEIRRARKAEREENRRKLFPIRLVDFEAIQKWECFDADGGKDLAVEMREYYIPDFSNWKDHDAFEKAFDRLLRDLKAEEKQA